MLRTFFLLLSIFFVTAVLWVMSSEKNQDKLAYAYEEHNQWSASDIMATPHIALAKNQKTLQAYLEALSAQAFELQRQASQNETSIKKAKNQLLKMVDWAYEYDLKRINILKALDSASPENKDELVSQLKNLDSAVDQLEVQANAQKKLIKALSTVHEKNLDQLAQNVREVSAANIKINEVEGVRALAEAYKFSNSSKNKSFEQSINDAVVQTQAISKYIDSSLRDSHSVIADEYIPFERTKDAAASLERLLDPQFLKEALNPRDDYFVGYRLENTDIPDLEQETGVIETLELSSDDLGAGSFLLLEEADK